MLEIVFSEDIELFNEDDCTWTVIPVKGLKMQLEHSLISLKKWEKKWHKPFLGNDEKTFEEITDYIRCMTLTKNVDPIIYQYFPKKQLDEVINYIQDPMTAAWFSEQDEKKSRLTKTGEVVTAEIIYYWMITLNIPTEFQKWHLNELITLIRVVNLKNMPKKKMSKQDAARERAALNAARRAKYNTRG